MVKTGRGAPAAPAFASARVSSSTVESGVTSATTTTLCSLRLSASCVGTPAITAGRRFGAFALAFAVALGLLFAATETFGGASGVFASAGTCFFTGCRGLIVWTGVGAADELGPRPRTRKPPRPRTSAPRPTSAGTRSRKFTRVLSAAKAIPFTRARGKKRGRGFRALCVWSMRPSGLAAARLDVGAGAGLVVLDGPGDCVDDAVRGRVRDRDLDVLDPGVVRTLQLRQRHAGVPGRVVSVVRLHPGHGRADVRLRRRVVGPLAEAEVRGNRNREQDSQNDDHDEKLDEGETLVSLHRRDPVRKPCEHVVILLGGCVGWLALVIGRPS